MIKLYFDGACYPNPGKIGKSGTIIYKDDELLLKDSHVIEGERITNNLMEYDGLYQGLLFLIEKKLQKESIEVYGDSLMVINQMKKNLRSVVPDKPNKTYKVYKEIAFKVKEVLDEFEDIRYNWIPRELNEEADKLTFLNFDYLTEEYLKVVS